MKESEWFDEDMNKKDLKIEVARSCTEKDVLDEYARLVKSENEKEGYREKIESLKEDKDKE